MNIIKLLFFSFVLLALCFATKAQEPDEIKKLQKQISNLTAKMNDSETKTRLLSRKLALSSSQIDNLNSEINRIENVIAENKKKIQDQEIVVSNLNKYIKTLLIYTYKTRNLRYKTTFFFSSTDFNEAYKRYLYVKFYRELLLRQIEDFKYKNDVLKKENLTLQDKKKELYILADSKTKQMLEQKQTAKQLENLTRSLKRNKSKVRAELRRKQAVLSNLNSTINEQIDQHKNSNVSASGFLKMKGKLISPMSGIITQKFGKHRHKILENVTINSNGIEITGSTNAKVNAVFTGKVSNISQIPGSAYAVIVQHGIYYSVYSNISSVKVKIGETVKSGTLIGYCASSGNESESSVLFFQIWKKKQKLNPQFWLKK